MRTNARRGAHALTMVVLTAAVSLSGRVEAQQGGLFPLAPIRRQRVPCDQEDPTYKIYKHQYFGYHPTCWRAFPPGWGCPSAEAPNKEKSFEQIKPGVDREESQDEMAPPDDRGPGPGPVRRPATVPDLPPERSPFDELPGNTPPARGAPPARPTPPAGRDDPFQDLNNPRGASNSTSRNRSQTRSAATAPDDGAPELAAPARQPAQGSASRSTRRDPGGDDLASDDPDPLLRVSDADIVRSDTSSADDSDSDNAATAPASTPAPAATPAAQPRRRFFGNFFSSLGSNWGK